MFADERAAAWTRIESASFLTVNEKRSVLGYAPIAGGDGLSALAARGCASDAALDRIWRRTMPTSGIRLGADRKIFMQIRDAARQIRDAKRS